MAKGHGRGAEFPKRAKQAVESAGDSDYGSDDFEQESHIAKVKAAATLIGKLGDARLDKGNTRAGAGER